MQEFNKTPSILPGGFTSGQRNPYLQPREGYEPLKVDGAAEKSKKDSNPKDSIGDKKVPLWLCSPIASAHWALAQFSGMLKYGAWNWRSAGVRSSVYVSAMRRHLDAYLSGEEYDPVDGSHHLGNIMACAAILLDAHAAGKLIDDRPPSVDPRPTYSFVETTMARLRGKYSEYLPGGPLAPKHYTIADTEREQA